MKRWAWLVVALVLGTYAESAHADRPRVHTASTFAPHEKAALLAGDAVTRPMKFARRGGQYVGGVAYQVVDATPAEVMSALGSAEQLPGMLPRTKSARLVSAGRKHAKVELVSGTELVDAKYTVVFKRKGRSELRFWLDQKSPHGIRDVWGYVRVRPFGKGSLVTVAVALDVGPGVVRMLFEDRIQRTILSTPQKIRDYLASSAVAKNR